MLSLVDQTVVALFDFDYADIKDCPPGQIFDPADLPLFACVEELPALDFGELDSKSDSTIEATISQRSLGQGGRFGTLRMVGFEKFPEKVKTEEANQVTHCLADQYQETAMTDDESNPETRVLAGQGTAMTDESNHMTFWPVGQENVQMYEEDSSTLTALSEGASPKEEVQETKPIRGISPKIEPIVLDLKLELDLLQGTETTNQEPEPMDVDVVCYELTQLIELKYAAETAMLSTTTMPAVQVPVYPNPEPQLIKEEAEGPLSLPQEECKIEGLPEPELDVNMNEAIPEMVATQTRPAATVPGRARGMTREQRMVKVVRYLGLEGRIGYRPFVEEDCERDEAESDPSERSVPAYTEEERNGFIVMPGIPARMLIGK